MATSREELLIIAKLQDRVSRPIADIRAESEQLVDTIAKADKATTEQMRSLRRLGTEMGQAQRATARLEREQEKLRKKNKELARSYVDVGERMTQAISAPALIGMGLATRAAINLQEQVTRGDTVFGRNAAAIQAWSQTSARSLGLSRRAALENASQFGNLFQQMDIGLDTATSMSQRLVELSADVASFANVSGGAERVLETFAASFRGEYDSVQRFIPTITAAAVEQKALQMGLAATTGELTAQDKALATYQLIINGTGAAAGDFSRTQGNAANQLRIAQAAIEDAAAELGENLLPLVAQGADLVATFAEAFGDLPEPVQSAILILGGIATVAGPIVFVIGKIKLLTLALQAQQAAGSAWAAGMTGMAGRVAGVLAAAGVGISAGSMINSNVDAQTAAWIQSLGPLDESNLQAVIARRNQIAAEQNRLFALQPNGLGDRAAQGLQNLNPWADNSFSRAQRGARDLTSEAERLDTVIEGLTRSERDHLRTTELMTGTIDEAASAYDALGEAIAATGREYDTLIGRFFTADQARLATRETIGGILERISSGGLLTPDDQLRAAYEVLGVVQAEVEARQRSGELASDLETTIAAQSDLLTTIGTNLLPTLNDELSTMVGQLETGAQAAAEMNDAFYRNYLNSVMPNANNTPVSQSDIDRITNYANGIGDTPSPLSRHVDLAGARASAAAHLGGGTLAAFKAIDAGIGGRRTITSHIRSWGLGSADSDHVTGRALDITGANLLTLRQRIREMGGAAELHGAGANRHLHAVPALGGGPAIDARATYTVNLDDTAGVERAAYQGIRRAQREHEKHIRRLSER